MSRKGLAFMAVLALAVLLVPQTALAEKPSRTCPPGFDLGELTLDDALKLPNILLGIADGVFDLESLTAGFESLDRNDDGLVCFKSFSSNANPASLLQYFYNTVDNNASVPSG